MVGVLVQELLDLFLDLINILSSLQGFLEHNQREPVGRNVQEVLAQNVEQPHDASLVEALDHLLQEVRPVLILCNERYFWLQVIQYDLFFLFGGNQGN